VPFISDRPAHAWKRRSDFGRRQIFLLLFLQKEFDYLRQGEMKFSLEPPAECPAGRDT
jgi:hypothetical protein